MENDSKPLAKNDNIHVQNPKYIAFVSVRNVPTTSYYK